jgi:hypothetical protein
MLTDLLEVRQGVLLALHDRGHPTQSGALELFTSVQRVTEFEQSAVILGHLGDEVAARVELTQG